MITPPVWFAGVGAPLARVAGQTQIHGDRTLLDSVSVRSPLPGGVASVVRFLFNLPQWFQIGGLFVGLAVAAVVLVLLWRRRRAIIAAIVALPRSALIALGGTVVVIVGLLALLGRVSWNYMQHNNDFCTGCHIMDTPYMRFQTSEHRMLRCHDCHQQSIFASSKELYYWVAERPQSIPPHAKVPNGICANCHETDTASHTWQRIAATAGHSTHLNSADPRLRNIQCVTCHGVEIHRFASVDQTCGQSGCHVDLRVKLGKMANQSELHCIMCHQFDAPIAENLSPDSAARVMLPAHGQCLRCHEMQNVMTGFDVTRDPHHGQCGWCHNPHTQTTPAEAVQSCTTSGCHVRPDTLTPMHRGLPAGTLAKCTTCHVAHTWTLRGEACLQCHQHIDRGARSSPHMRSASADSAMLWAAAARSWPGGSFTTASAGPHARVEEMVRLVAASLNAPHPTVPRVAAPRADTLPAFSHAIHKALPCASCHRSTQAHGALLVHSVQDCLACHHAPSRVSNCQQCHKPQDIPARVAVATTFRTSVRPEPAVRTLTFTHAEHARVACATCHTQAVTLAPRGCAECHDQHHRATVDCLDCHQPAPTAHDRRAHLGCSGSGCHTDAAVLALAPARNVCLVCHQQQVNHQPGQDCAACHAAAWTPIHTSAAAP